MPVVQAFRQLITEGFLTTEARKGVRVANPNAAEIRERYLMFIALETLCATESFRVEPKDLARAMRRELTNYAASDRSIALETESDRVFHESLWKSSGLPMVEAQLALLWGRGSYYRVLLLQRSQYLEHRLAEHEVIVLAAENGNLDQFVEALTQHRMAGMDRMLQVLVDETKLGREK
jgi:DNA-binding GntR family transcriptional regulator